MEHVDITHKVMAAAAALRIDMGSVKDLRTRVPYMRIDPNFKQENVVAELTRGMTEWEVGTHKNNLLRFFLTSLMNPTQKR